MKALLLYEGQIHVVLCVTLRSESLSFNRIVGARKGRIFHIGV
jgi:hypothetical protein